MEFKHIPVMLEETINGLNIKEDGIYVDGTIGGAGHSKEILKRLSDKGLLIGIDRDTEALENSRERLAEISNNFKLVHGNHDDIKEILNDLDIEKVDGILLDLGVSSYQLDNAERGFSYLTDYRLDMRMDKTQSLSAYEVVNEYEEEKLYLILKEYGEEKFAKKIARNIVLERAKKPIETSQELVKVIEKSKPFSKKGHIAKQTFQAIRIEVNNELKPLYNTIRDSIDKLESGGRLCVITFHSLEDKIVKMAFIDAKGYCTCPKDLPVCVCNFKSEGEIITRKPIEASEEEKEINSRSKSAKLRIFEKK